jgi:thiol-disulfide isomerase/thioredoxin
VLEFVWAQFAADRPSLGRSGFGFGFGAACPAATAAKPSHGEADYDWQLQVVGEDETALHVFRNRVIFVNVWATWCGPCREEMPSIQSLYNTLGNEVAFVVVSEEEESTVREFMERNGYTFPAYVSRQELPPVFESNGIPATFFINRQGQIVHKRIGSADWNDASCQAFLRSLL